VRRVVCREFGADPEIEEVPDTEPGPAQVSVAVGAAAVSFVDGLLVRGLYQIKPPLPYVPGMAAAGRVIAVGEGVDGLAVGQRVLAAGGGCWADRVTVAARACTALPDSVPDDVAAACVEGYATARFALTVRTRVEPGEWVVVLGAGGGVGSATVDVARSLGARVLAVASSPARLDVARRAGAEAVVDASTEDVKARIRELTGGGADIVVDPVGGALAESALRALRPYGRLLVVGFASGDIPRLPANHVLLTNRSVIGVDWGDHCRRDPAHMPAAITAVLDDIAAGRLHPQTPEPYPLDKATDALTELARRRVAGKLVLIP